LRDKLTEQVRITQTLQGVMTKLTDGDAAGVDDCNKHIAELAVELSKAQSAVSDGLVTVRQGRLSQAEQHQHLEELVNARRLVCDKIATVDGVIERLEGSQVLLVRRKAELDAIEDEADLLLSGLGMQRLCLAHGEAGGRWPVGVPCLPEKGKDISCAWVEYRSALAHEQKLAATATASDDPWVAVEPSVSTEWAAAVTVLEVARLRLEAAVQVEGQGYEAFAGRLRTAGGQLGAHIQRQLRHRRRALEKDSTAVIPALGRARALHQRMAAIRGAAARQKDVCDSYLDVQDEVDDLNDEVDRLGKVIQKAERRRKPVEKEKEQLVEAKKGVKALLGGARYCRAKAQLRKLMKYLPELFIQFRGLDPFNGTAAQALPPRELDEYDHEELGQGVGGRHRMLKARLKPEEGGPDDEEGVGQARACTPPNNHCLHTYISSCMGSASALVSVMAFTHTCSGRGC
jgi:hypothetical protein